MGLITHLMDKTITVAGISAVDNHGDPTFSAQTTLVARIELTDELIVGPDGNEARANHTIATETAIKYTDRIWLPGDSTGDATAAKRPLRITYANIPNSSDGFYEVFV